MVLQIVNFHANKENPDDPNLKIGKKCFCRKHLILNLTKNI